MKYLPFVIPALCLALGACAAPTLEQRVQAWERYRDVTRATCLVGAAKDPAMPTDVRAWCAEVTAP